SAADLGSREVPSPFPSPGRGGTMKSVIGRESRFLGLFVSLMAGSLGLAAVEARALSPKSPEVKASVARALDYLAKHDDRRDGGQVVVGLTFLKADQPEHPKVQRALAAAERVI